MLLNKILQQKTDQRRADLYKAIIQYEARLGGELFGAVPKGHRREFFCLDEHTWVWHEEWKDEQGQPRAVTTRYEVRPNGVIKAQGNHPYQRLSTNEARNLYRATQLYSERVGSELERLSHAA